MQKNSLLKSFNFAILMSMFGFAPMSAQAFNNSAHDIYDYEGGRACQKACIAPATQSYTTPISTYQQPSAYQPSSLGPVSCPSGTIAQSDGSCLQQGSSYVPTSYDTSSYSSSSYSSSGAAYSSSVGAVDCPSGTTLQSDGSCLQQGSSYTPASYNSSSYSSSSYGSSGYGSSGSTYSGSAGAVDCPSGTSLQSDGSCLEQGSFLGSSHSSSSYSSSSWTQSSSAAAEQRCPSGTLQQNDGTCSQLDSSFKVEIFDAPSPSTGSNYYTPQSYYSPAESNYYSPTNYNVLRK